jgi:hypothetical protein
MHSWSSFDARTSHEQTCVHKIHHDLREATTFPLIVFSMPGHEANTQMSFCPRTPKLRIPKFLKLRLLQLWKPITSFTNLQSKWSLKQSCSHHQDLSNGTWNATFTKGNQGNSWRLVVGSQTTNLTPYPSLAITYVLRTQMGHARLFYTSKFQDIFNDLMNFSIQWVLTPPIAL